MQNSLVKLMLTFFEYLLFCFIPQNSLNLFIFIHLGTAEQPINTILSYHHHKKRASKQLIRHSADKQEQH